MTGRTQVFLKTLLLGMGLVIVSLLLSVSSYAQGSRKITLSLTEAATGEAIPFATVSIHKGSSESATKYSITDKDGKVTLSGVPAGKYTLKAELMGYKTLSQEIEVKDADLNLGVLKLDTDSEMLDAAKVSDVGNPIVIKKDTVEYNVSSFRVTDNDVLEDLLKKFPGMEVAEDGSIKYNGESITKITIDGKTFFLDDPQLASKNLPAKMINKVKVVRKKSEQAEFTGIDDGQETTILDLSVRPGMMNGLFGNVTAGGGHDIPESGYYSDEHPWTSEGWRYQGSLFSGRFTDHSQISLILNGNNTNNRSFSDLAGGMMGGMRGGGGGMGGGANPFGTGNGITSSWMAGLNGAWDLFDNKMNAGGNYVYNGTDRLIQEERLQSTYYDDMTLDYSTKGTSRTGTYGHRFGARVEHKFSDNTSILFEPQINFGGGSFSEESVFETLRNAQTKTNDGFSFSGGSNNSLSTSGRFLFRQRLGIPGRTLTVGANYSLSRSDIKDGLNQSLTNNYAGGTVVPEIVNQRYVQNQNSTSLSGNATYTEPLGNNFYVEGNYQISYSNSFSDKKTYDSESTGIFTADSHLFGDMTTGVFNPTYSNEITNRYITHTAGANMLYQGKGLRAQVGMAVMPTSTDNITVRSGREQTYHSDVVNYSPRAMVQYEISENSNLRFFYNGRSSQPSTSQLMPVPDNTNPLRVSFGNPALEPSFSHSLRGEYRFTNRQTFTSFNLSANGSLNQNPTVNATWHDSDGVTYNMPVNGHSSASINVRAFLNSPIAKSNFSVSNQLSFGYSTSSSYVGTSSFNTARYYKDGEFDYDLFNSEHENMDKTSDFNKNTLQNITGSDRLRLTYRNDNLEVSAGASTNFSRASYSTATTDPNMLFNNQVNSTLNWNFGNGFTAQAEMNYNWYNGYAESQRPDSEYILNAYISKLLFKNQLTLTLRGYDLLNQAKNMSSTDNGNVHTVMRNNTLGRYVILSLTWRFGNFGGNRGQRGGQRGGMGRPGGMGGPPMGGGGFGGGRPPMM